MYEQLVEEFLSKYVRRHLNCHCYVLDQHINQLAVVEFKSVAQLEPELELLKLQLQNSLTPLVEEVTFSLQELEAFLGRGKDNSSEAGLAMLTKLHKLLETAKQNLPEEYLLLGDLLLQASCLGLRKDKPIFTLTNDSTQGAIFRCSAPYAGLTTYIEPFLILNKQGNNYCSREIIYREGEYELAFFLEKRTFVFKAKYQNGGFKLNQSFTTSGNYRNLQQVFAEKSHSPLQVFLKCQELVTADFYSSFYDYLD